MPFKLLPFGRPVGGNVRRTTLTAMLVAALFWCLAGRAAFADTRILFIGNSFTFAAGSSVQSFHPEAVHDLNGGKIGGVPALFARFTEQAGLHYDVSLETSPGKGLDWHYANAADKIGQSWNVVVMHGFSTLNAVKPGNPALLVSSVRQVATLLHEKNPSVSIFLMATWTRADQTYTPKGHWYGKPVDAMEKDVRAGYDLAAAGCPFVHGVIPVGEAWNRAIQTGFADANPYDGIDTGKVDLWTNDNYHGSMYGYYLEALTVFGSVTGLDPRSLGADEQCAHELGISAKQAAAMQQIAYDQLIANGSKSLRSFQPVTAKAKDLE
jgi:hypothetical protein